MKPVYQTRKEANGNCLQACVAALLDLPLEKVPDFVLEPDVEGCPFPGYWLSLQGWLNDRGLFFLEVQLPPNMPWMSLPFDALCIFFGKTTNGIRHSIIGKASNDSFIPVFNPWPEAEFADGVGALGFILPRDPSSYMRIGIGMAKVARLTKGPVSDLMVEVHAIATEALGESLPVVLYPNGARP